MCDCDVRTVCDLAVVRYRWVGWQFCFFFLYYNLYVLFCCFVMHLTESVFFDMVTRNQGGPRSSIGLLPYAQPRTFMLRISDPARHCQAWGLGERRGRCVATILINSVKTQFSRFESKDICLRTGELLVVGKTWSARLELFSSFFCGAF